MVHTQADLSAEPISERERRQLAYFANKKKLKALRKQQHPSDALTYGEHEKQLNMQSKNWVEETPAGQRKILKPLDNKFHKSYMPKVVESAWYSFWENQGLFKPRTEKDGSLKPKGKYVIAIPPPNVWTHACIDGMFIC